MRNVGWMTGSTVAQDWRGRRVLVTGAGGFIGSHAVEKLVGLGANVRALLRYSSRGGCGALRWSAPGTLASVELVQGDLRDAESVASAVAGCDTVLHLGAQVSVPYSYVNVRDFFETNTMGTLNVALAACRERPRRLLLVSSSEVYGSAQFVPINEDHPVRPQSPYAASKIAAEQVILSFAHSFNLEATIVRPFNCYGPRQTARAVVPMILSQAVTRSSIRLGSLWPRRDLTYVEDTVAGLLALAHAPAAAGGIFNLGTGYDASIGELVELAAAAVGRDLEVEVDQERIRPPSSEVSRLQCDPAKAAAAAGWAAKVSLADGLVRTAEWIGEHLSEYGQGDYLI
jgi:nucleoside-diphosphate-sugar epimerase